jgi:hypothetical protein
MPTLTEGARRAARHPWGSQAAQGAGGTEGLKAAPIGGSSSHSWMLRSCHDASLHVLAPVGVAGAAEKAA